MIIRDDAIRKRRNIFTWAHKQGFVGKLDQGDYILRAAILMQLCRITVVLTVILGVLILDFAVDLISE